MNTYVFDGAIVRVLKDSIDAVREVLNDVGAERGVQFSVHEFDAA